MSTLLHAALVRLAVLLTAAGLVLLGRGLAGPAEEVHGASAGTLDADTSQAALGQVLAAAAQERMSAVAGATARIQEAVARGIRVQPRGARPGAASTARRAAGHAAPHAAGRAARHAAGHSARRAGRADTRRGRHAPAAGHRGHRRGTHSAGTPRRHAGTRLARARAGTAARHRPRPRPRGGADISWPQCPHTVGANGRHGLDQPMPDPNVRFVVVGLTNGRGLTANPCLDRHLRWVRTHHVWAAAYAFLTYPSDRQLRRLRASGPYRPTYFYGKLGNAAYATARHSIRVMRRHHFTSPHVWLDLEPSSSRPWSGRPAWNAVVVRGWVRAFREAGHTVGFYSTKLLWRDIVGPHYRPGAPEWRTAGPASPGAALGRCSESSFQGGRAVIAQWWNDRHDFDRMCPAFAGGASMRRFFHKY